MVLTVRSMQGRELKYIQDHALIKSGAFLDRILAACTEAVQDPGPYAFQTPDAAPDAPAPGPIVDWDAVLPGDKFFALLRIRAATFGDDFSFPRKCPTCGPYQWDLKLSDLPVKKLAPADAAKFKAGEPMEVRVPSSGALVKYRLSTGKDDKASARAKNEANALIAMFARRIFSIEGVETNALRPYLETLGLGDLFALTREMEKHDCGVETSIEIFCPKCEVVEKVGLPIGPDFWLPGRA